MNLRTKLLAGYLIFVTALIVLGGWSAWRLREMGDVSRRIISNNYDSVVAAQEMKESLERQDSAGVFALLGAREKAAAQLREHRTRFDANFKKAETTHSCNHSDFFFLLTINVVQITNSSTMWSVSRL